QVIGGVVGNLEAPADGAAIAGVDVAAVEIGRASCRGRVWSAGRGVGVGEDDIGEADAAAGVESAGDDGDVLGDRAVGVAGDDRGFVGAGDGDGDGLDGGGGRAVISRDDVIPDQGPAGRQVIGGVVGNLEAPADGAAIAGVDVAAV